MNSSLKGRYRLLAQIGKGGFGAVYRAEDTQLGNRLVAVKEMQLAGLGARQQAEATDAFHHEALLLASLTHPNLPRIYDHFSEDGRWYLVMDFIQGETLEARLDEAPGGRLSLDQTLRVGLQLCQVLEYLHTRQPPIIFRDLKPSNVMLTPDGQLYLLDFGIARLFKPGQARDTVAFGSPGYAAPEQYGKAQTTPRSDVYGLGALLHHLLSGHDPSETPFRFAPLADPGLDGIGRLIEQMTQLDESRRPASMALAQQELEALAASAANGQRASGQISGAGQSRGMTLPAAPPLIPQLHGAPAPGARILKGVQPTYKGHMGRVNALAWSPDGACIVSGSADKSMQVWAVAAGKNLWTQRGHLKWVLAVAWSPDGSRVISAGASLFSWWHNTVQVWDVKTGKKILTYSGHSKWVLAVAWSPDGGRVASAGGGMFSRGDDGVNVWEATSDKTLVVCTGHANKISTVAWSPDGTRLVSGSADETARVWDAATGQELVRYPGHGWSVRAVAWSPDGTRIASGGDRTVQVWYPKSKVSSLVYRGHANKVLAVAWSPDGREVASASVDGTVQVWEADTGKTLICYQGHTGPVSAVAWSPDGRWIASGGADTTVQVWEVR